MSWGILGFEIGVDTEYAHGQPGEVHVGPDVGRPDVIFNATGYEEVRDGDELLQAINAYLRNNGYAEAEVVEIGGFPARFQAALAQEMRGRYGVQVREGATQEEMES